MTSKNKISATEFSPIQTPIPSNNKEVSNRSILLIMLIFASGVIVAFLMLSRSVIFITQPEGAKINVDGLSFNIGKNYLFLQDEYVIRASKEGYFTLEEILNLKEDYSPEIKLNLIPLPGDLKIDSDQSPIEVILDNVFQGETPLIIENIDRGLHELTFKKYGYFTKNENVEIQGLGKKQKLNISLDPSWGNVTFSSIPNNAMLSVDGKLQGKTPITTKVLETGSEISISLPGYKTFVNEVFVKAGSFSEYETISMELADGLLSLISQPPSANVTINGSYVGTTPLNTQLNANQTHKIDLYLDGYLKTSKNISLNPEEKFELEVNLIENIGEIYIDITPKDASVRVDGRSVRSGSQTLKLPAKQHQVSISKTGFETKVLSINPRPQMTQSISVNLMTLEQAYWASRPEIITSPVGTKLRLFKPNGEIFFLGAPRREPGRRANEAKKLVQLNRPFYLATTELSNAEYREWRSGHNSSSIRGVSLDLNTQPVSNISWEDAALFCNWLSEKEGLSQFYEVTNKKVSSINWNSNGYRLPTESEWAWVSKISKNGDSRIFPWKGSSYPPSEVADNYADETASAILPFVIKNYNDQNTVSANVGSYKPNEKKIFNLSGNVSEWTNDFYEIRANNSEPLVDYRGPNSGNRHVIRGASWALGSRSELRLSFRQPGREQRPDVGFRIARYVDAPGEDL